MNLRPRITASTRRWSIVGLVGLSTLTPALLEAQTWRTAEMARQLRDSAAHEVSVYYAGGRFTLSPADGPLLYRANLRYDESRTTPEVRYSAEERRVRIGLEMNEESGRGQQRLGTMQLALTRDTPLDLDIALGAVEADLELGGLTLREVRVESGASSARVSFDEPNRTRLEVLDLHSGAASLTATGLANANAPEIRVGSGVGNVELDFGGRWTGDIETTIDVALGRVRIRVPDGVGIRVEMSKVLARFEHPGLEKQGDAWVSSNWESATHHLVLRINTAFGTVHIERSGD